KPNAGHSLKAARTQSGRRDLDMVQVKLFGYADKISVKPGDVIQFHVNAEGTGVAQAHLVRLVHDDHHPDGPAFIGDEIHSAANGAWKVEKQYTQVGSFLKVADAGGKLALLTSLTVFAFVYPTLPKLPGGQCLIGRWDNCSRQGYRLGVNKHGCLGFCVGH